MAGTTESVDVAVPIRTVYNQWTQFEEFPRFMSGVKEVRQLGETMTHWVVEIGGVTREFDARITEQLPDERVAWSSTSGTKQGGVVTFHRIDAEHTRVTAQLEMEPEGLAEQVADKVGLVDRRIKGDLERFREFIESRGQETGGWRGEVDRPQP
jgi:uncharacterized membrane protein